jgi:trehalose 6-phosphate synthase/phosphatase
MRILTASNRLPFVVATDGKDLCLKEATEGVAAGINTYLQRSLDNVEFLWFGAPARKLPEHEKLDQFVAKSHFVPVYLKDEVLQYSERFCNKTIWPLFHYFPAQTSYDLRQWQNYLKMNESFSNAMQPRLKTGDTIWIQDYHLMKLPQMLRKIVPANTRIGLFLNIPFPAYEVFRQLPSAWSSHILSGLLACDLIGFQTEGYAQSFIRCVNRLMSLQSKEDRICFPRRSVQIASFPAGIDFEKFYNSSLQSNVMTELEILNKNCRNIKVILSVDRLDYSKGILNRLLAYEKFLKTNSHWHKKVTFLLVIAPSRLKDEYYLSIKKKIDETVGRINGEFGTFRWNPIVYQHKFMPFEKLAALYNYSDVMMVTPLREGMNLLAKEYVASKRSKVGVLILSEMAGAAKELVEAITVNPNDIDAIVNSISSALSQPLPEQAERIERMQKHLKDKDVIHWADNFLNTLINTPGDAQINTVNQTFVFPRAEILNQFQTASERLLFLDYDGTLISFFKRPEEAIPGERLKRILHLLGGDPFTDVVIISGRTKTIIERWFSNYPVNFIAEHGIWLKKINRSWEMLGQFSTKWKTGITAFLSRYLPELPGSFIEEKDYSIVFHYRTADPQKASNILPEIKEALEALLHKSRLEIIEGNKVLEIRYSEANKANAITRFINDKQWPFIIAFGDDRTDEDMFEQLPGHSITVKVGPGMTSAKYRLESPENVLDFLESLITEGIHKKALYLLSSVMVSGAFS